MFVRHTSFALVLALVAVWAITLEPACADGIEPGLLKELRDATVLIHVGEGKEASSGSGFLIRKDGERGYVLTNHHVVGERENAEVEVVLFSGSQVEAVIVGRVISSSKSADLALVHVESKDLPKPISVGEKTIATETTRTYLFGFPFGAELGGDRKNPSITISPATVSSLRESDDGEIETVQLDGNLNPGNSGGPVLDEKGQLVGVAVATIRNAGIGFAIPVERVQRFLKGDISLVTMGATRLKGEFEVEVMLTDPFYQIRTVRGEYSVDGGDPQAFSCTRKSQSASTKIWAEGAPSVVRLTMVAELLDGTIIEKTPLEIPIRGGKVGPAKMVSAKPRKGDSPDAPPPFRKRVPNDSKAVRVDFGGKVVAITPSPDGAGAFVVREGERTNELVFWDAKTSTVGDRIQVPRAPKHVAVFGDKVLLTCPDSGVLVVIDPETKKIVNAAPVSGSGKPFQVCQTADTHLAYVLATPTGSKPEREAFIVEVDLENRESQEIRKGDIERAAVMGNNLACQENFGGSPSGIPKVVNVGDVGNTRRGFPHASFGPFYPSRRGLFVATHKGKTVAFEPQDNLNDVVWSQDGILVTSWTDQTRFLVTKGDDLENPEELPLMAVSETGSVLWKVDLPLPRPVSMFLTKNLFEHNRHKKLLVGTARHGSVFAVAHRIANTAMSQAFVVGNGPNDKLLFCLSNYKATIHSRFGIMLDEGDRDWYSIALPQSKNAGARQPLAAAPFKDLKVGDQFLYRPKLAKPKGTYQLKTGPDGMKVDSQTGAIEWATTIGSLGQWDIEIIDQTDAGAESILKFELNVQL